MLYGRRERLEALDVPKLEPAPDTVPERLETGTQNHEGIVGAAAAVDYLASLAREDDGATSAPRRARLRGRLRGVPRTWVCALETALGRTERDRGRQALRASARRAADADACVHRRGTPADEVSRKLADRGIFASHGDFYATTVARRLGVGDAGFVRIGCACYTIERRGRPGHRGGAGRSATVKDRRPRRAVHSLLRKLGMRVGRVEVLVPDRVVEAVERNRSRLRVAIDVAGDALRAEPEPAGIFAVRRRRVEVVAAGAPVVDGNRVGNRMVEDMTGDAVADRIGPVGRIRGGRVVVRADLWDGTSDRGERFPAGLGEDVAGDSFEPKSRHVEMENDFRPGVIDGAKNAVFLEHA